MKLLIIIPAYNESENIEFVVNDLINNYPQYDYVVVNDGSKDATGIICELNGFNIIDMPINLGLAGAFQGGMKYAYLNEYDAAIQFDGDGQHDPHYITLMLEVMSKENADIVIASRFKEKRRPNTLRMLGSRMLEYAIKITTGKTLKDPTSGMRLFNKRMLKLFADNINFGPEPDTLSHLIRCGANIAEVQANMHERAAGESYLTKWRSVSYMVNMMLSIFAIQFIRRKEV